MFNNRRYIYAVSVLLGTLISVFSCDNYEESDFDLNTLFTITGNTTMMPADGESFIPITISINPDADADKREITLTTDMGTFGNGMATASKAIDVEGKAIFNLKSGQIGTANLKTAISNTSFFDLFEAEFMEAKASRLRLTISSAPFLNNGVQNSIQINVIFERDKGLVSLGQEFEWSLMGLPMTSAVVFNQTVSDPMGKASFQFTVKDDAFVGDISLKVNSESIESQALSLRILDN